jgi:hypothetical protein
VRRSYGRGAASGPDPTATVPDADRNRADPTGGGKVTVDHSRICTTSRLLSPVRQTLSMDRIERLVGVYDADGTLFGEVAYVVGHLLGRRSCALCDITHGGLKRRPEFDEAAATLEVPFDLVHRDETSAEMADFVDGQLPCVVAEGDGQRRVLLDRDALVACGKDPVALADAIRSAAAAAQLTLRPR